MMSQRARDYLENTVLAALKREYPKLMPDLMLMSGGSTGLGCDDEFSDFEAFLYLKEDLWQDYGWKIQIVMNRCLRANNPWKGQGSAICVEGFGGLWAGHAHAFIAGNAPPPWEEVAHHDLFNMQEQTAIHDPQGLLAKLKQATAPQKVPQPLWRKWLVKALYNLYANLYELALDVKRSRLPEAHVAAGLVIEDLFRIGFLINRKYSPWRAHLRWGFEKLGGIASEMLPDLDAAVSTSDWKDKLARINAVKGRYLAYIQGEHLLPTLNLVNPETSFSPEIGWTLGDELLWGAERIECWINENWRDWINRCTERARQDGRSPADYWVYSFSGKIGSYRKWKELGYPPLDEGVLRSIAE